MAYARSLYERFRVMSSHRSELVLEYRVYLAAFLSQQGNLDEADVHFDAMLADEADLTPLMQRRLDGFYGEHLAARGRSAEAETRLVRALTGWTDHNPHLWPTDRARLELVRLYDESGRSDEAAGWR